MEIQLIEGSNYANNRLPEPEPISAKGDNMNCVLFDEYIKAVYNDKTWPNRMKPGVLAWSIAEQGERRHEVNGMGELARFADNYHSLHQRPEMAAVYPCTYHLVATTEVDNNYCDFPSPADEIRGLHLFIHRPVYGNVDSHMGSFEELQRFIFPKFCPRKDYVEYVLGFLPEAEMELRKLGWTTEEEPIPEPVTEQYNIKNGLLYYGNDPIPYFESPNKDKWIKNTPKSIVLHYTASLGVQGNINWFMNPKNRVSAHLLIGQTGIVAQCVPFHVPAWHSGSTYYNRNSIGIELEGLGCTKLRLGDYALFPKWNGIQRIPITDCVYAPHKKEPRNYRYWPKFTDAQYSALNNIIPVLRKEYEWGGVLGLVELGLLGHEIVWKDKIDPGPAFDWNRIA